MGKHEKNVFISHVHEDDEEVQALKELLKRSGYEIKDGSIDSRKPNEAKSPDYIKYKILAPRINWASVMIVLISPETHTSDYVEWEIDHAEKKDKRIVGVSVRGGQESDLPKSFEMYGDTLVGWQSQSVVDAIEGRIDGWHSPTGEPLSRDRDITRYSCSK